MDETEKSQLLARFQVGNTVTYGSWEGKDIAWRVLEQRGKLRLLYAEDIVLRHCYNSAYIDTYWQSCALRKYLNGPFLKEAFSERERAAIMAFRVTTPRNENFYCNGGPATSDKLFVFSPEELTRFFPDQSDRAKGDWYWLRCPGCNLLTAVGVYQDGSVYLNGINVHYDQGGVRPAMWVLLR
jgi:hypothetical protein